MNERERYHARGVILSMASARACRAFIDRNPARYDVPQARRAIAAHVEQARQHNRAYLQARREARS